MKVTRYCCHKWFRIASLLYFWPMAKLQTIGYQTRFRLYDPPMILPDHGDSEYHCCCISWHHLAPTKRNISGALLVFQDSWWKTSVFLSLWLSRHHLLKRKTIRTHSCFMCYIFLTWNVAVAAFFAIFAAICYRMQYGATWPPSCG